MSVEPATESAESATDSAELATEPASPSRALTLVTPTLACALLFAGVTGPLPGLAALAAAAGVSTAVHGVLLARLALRDHRRRRATPARRGAALIALSLLVTGATVVAAASTSAPARALDPGGVPDPVGTIGPAGGVAAISGQEPLSGLLAFRLCTAGLLVATVLFLLGLLLPVGAATDQPTPLRRALDGAAVGVCLLYGAWLMVLWPPAGGYGFGAAVALIGCVGLAVALAPGLRAAGYRSAALASRAGAVLSLTGLCAAVALFDDAPSGGRLLLAGLALVLGPVLCWTGARAAAPGGAPVPAPSTPGGPGFGGYPTLAVPFGAALAATGYRLVDNRPFDTVSVALGLAVLGALGVREFVAVLDIRRYAREVAAREARFRSLVAGSADITVVLDDDLMVTWQSAAAARHFGLADQDVLDHPITALVHPDDVAAVRERLAAVLAGRQDDSAGWHDNRATRQDNRAPAGWRARGARNGRRATARATGRPEAAAATGRPDAMTSNGWPEAAAANQRPDATGPGGRPEAAAANARRHTAPAPILLSARLRDGSGRWRDTESTISDQRAVPEVGAVVVHVRDVGERRESERALHRMAFTDQLTELANRRQLVRTVGAMRAVPGQPGALLLIALDGLSQAGNGRGREVDEAVLVEVARRLRSAVDASDLPARVSGNEFAVATANHPVGAYAAAHRILAELHRPYQLPGATVHLNAAVGLAELAGAASVADTLGHAGLALRRARQLPRNRIEWYDEALEAALLRRFTLEEELPGVVARGELDLVFQPIVDLFEEVPVGAEALLRWRHPRRGTVLAADFVPVAEDLGLIDEIGDWVLQHACRQLAGWLRDGLDLWLSVNLAARQLAAPDLVARVGRLLERHQIPPERLVLEVTEQGLDADPQGAIAQLAGLRALGVRTALARFGTGATPLASLRRLPVDVLKVDRALFAGPAGRPESGTPLIDVVVGLGRRLGLEIVAEGLENEVHLDLVRTGGCRYGQGFLFGRPEPAEHFEAYLESHRSPTA
jgi:diguanylate cyclase (GGDEF)-like protein/PAS domain S-box-containing protein